MNGETCSGVTTFLLKQEIDTGNIIFQEKVEIGEEMTAGELHDELMEKGADLLLKTVQAMEAGDYPLTDQCGLLRGREAVLAPKIFKEDMKIRWNGKLETIVTISGLVAFSRGMDGITGCREGGGVLTLKIFKAARDTGRAIICPRGKSVPMEKPFLMYMWREVSFVCWSCSCQEKKECGRRTF